MPAKGKRVASRQAQLNRRRRRQARAGADTTSQTAVMEGEPVSTTVAPPVRTATVNAAANIAPAASQAQALAETSSDADRSRGPSRAAQPMAYTHLGAEFKRITILAGIVTVVLVAISFVV